MKKIMLFFIGFNFSIISLIAQNTFQYQAIARMGNELLTEKPIELKVTLLQNEKGIYSETHKDTTNQFGLFNLEIGSGKVETGDFSQIDWSSNDFSIKVMLGDQLMGINKIHVVPISAYAISAAGWQQEDSSIVRTNHNVRVYNNLNLEDGVFRIWKYNESYAPALQVLKHSNNAYPNQTVFEATGGIIDISPKSFKIFTSNSDPSLLKAQLEGNLNIEDGAFRIWKYNKGITPAFQVFKHSNLEYPNQTVFEAVGGVVDVNPKKFRIFTANDDPWTLRAELDGSFKIMGGVETKTLRTEDEASVKILEIRGGADIIEKTNSTQKLEPGEIVIIDDSSPNHVLKSAKKYDKRVCGIVSGAGGINPGMVLAQEGVLDGDVPIAIAGRVKVKVIGDIKPGDLLTTSDKPGFAMKVKNRKKGFGAIIGKALEFSDEEGMVLILVNLQ